MMEAAVRDVLSLPDDAAVNLHSSFYNMGGSSGSQLSFRTNCPKPVVRKSA
jgi:hypothetical protein